MKGGSTPLSTVAIMPSPTLLWRFKVSVTFCFFLLNNCTVLNITEGNFKFYVKCIKYFEIDGMDHQSLIGVRVIIHSLIRQSTCYKILSWMVHHELQQLSTQIYLYHHFLCFLFTVSKLVLCTGPAVLCVGFHLLQGQLYIFHFPMARCLIYQ